MKKNINKTVILSVTAVMDLLGFSNHLILSNNDIRSRIGNEAIQRLRTLEKALKLMEEERRKYPEIYPNNFYYKRFNDAIFLVFDIKKHIIPTVGNIDVPDGFSISNLQALAKKEIKSHDIKKYSTKFYASEGFKLAKFVGAVAKLHTFVNEMEEKNNFPGCRTVIASGLRKKFVNKEGKEDIFSANFSLSNAYLANKQGKTAGIIGSNLFLEDNVECIISYDHYSKAILIHSNILHGMNAQDPYDILDASCGIRGMYNARRSDKLKIHIFNKDYYFRKLSANSLTTFHIIPIIKDLLDGKAKEEDGLIKKLVHTIRNTPKSEEIIKAKNLYLDYPLLNLCIDLGGDDLEMLSEWIAEE